MGSQKALKKVKGRAIKFTICSTLMGIFMFLLGGISIIVEEVVVGSLFMAMAILMVAIMIIQIRVIANPKRDKQIKKNPQILTMWDEVYENVVYEDKDVIYSEDIVANKRYVNYIVYFKDIIHVTESTCRSGMFVVSHTLNLTTKDKKKILIGVYGKSKEKVKKIVSYICNHCTNLEENMGEKKYISRMNSKVQ